MNQSELREQIKKIGDECTEYVTGTLNGDYDRVDVVRFAQKIAALCADMAADIDGGECQISREIRKAFGVE